ncbi:hypothetical protein GCM10023145_38770 [Angustibacter luteus]
MPDREFEQLAANWWEFQRRTVGSRQERRALEQGQPAEVQAADDAVRAMVDAGGDAGVAFLRRLNDASPPHDDGETVGAGPLEDLLHEHGDSVVDAIELNARQSPSFARALSHAWLEKGHNTPAVEARLARWTRSRNPGS